MTDPSQTTHTTHPTGGQPFGQRLAATMAERGQLCLGIDPHPELMQDWGLPVDVNGVEHFSRTVIEVAHDYTNDPHQTGGVAVLKPQVAFYERYGSAGFAVLETVLAEAREAGILTIADAKRGDIGSTMAGYATGWLADGSALAADALTLSPYLGYESLRPAIELARRHHRGVFVLGLTSNPEGAQVQHRGGPENSVARTIIDRVSRDNKSEIRHTGTPVMGSVGLVIGATVASRTRELGIDLSDTQAPLLAPGFGAQGAGVDDVVTGFGRAWPQVLVNSSRGILRAGPQRSGIQEAIENTLCSLARVHIA